MELTKIHISDIGRIVTGKTPKTSIAENYGGNIPFLTPSDNLLYKSSPKTIKTLTEKGLDEVRNCLLPPHSVCVSCIGSDLGKVVMTIEPTVTNQQFNSIIPNKKFNANFVYYLMILVGRELNYLSKTSTAVPIINKSSFSSYEVEVPNLEIQEKIASILSSLDDKIELNRCINENLEQQAQALFKSWFVDFEPFKDGKFVDSELGMIPEGWKVIELQSMVTIKRGGSPRPIQEYLSETGLRWLKISDATCNSSPFILEIKEHIKESGLNKTVLLNKGELVLSNSATPGIPKFLGVDSCIHDGWLYFPVSSLSKEFLYLLFKEKRNELLSQGNGSVFLNLKTEIVKSLKIAICPKNTLDKFDNIIMSLFKKINELSLEIDRLTKLRDTLLPKLMTGEIKID